MLNVVAGVFKHRLGFYCMIDLFSSGSVQMRIFFMDLSHLCLYFKQHTPDFGRDISFKETDDEGAVSSAVCKYFMHSDVKCISVVENCHI